MQENKTNHVETKFLFIFSRSGAELAVGSVSGRLVAAPLPLHPRDGQQAGGRPPGRLPPGPHGTVRRLLHRQVQINGGNNTWFNVSSSDLKNITFKSAVAVPKKACLVFGL